MRRGGGGYETGRAGGGNGPTLAEEETLIVCLWISDDTRCLCSISAAPAAVAMAAPTANREPADAAMQRRAVGSAGANLLGRASRLGRRSGRN